jgi:hypothetical protein
MVNQGIGAAVDVWCAVRRGVLRHAARFRD